MEERRVGGGPILYVHPRMTSHTDAVFIKRKKSRYLLETDPVPHRWFRPPSNGSRAAEWRCVTSEEKQTLISAPAFLPLPRTSLLARSRARARTHARTRANSDPRPFMRYHVAVIRL